MESPSGFFCHLWRKQRPKKILPAMPKWERSNQKQAFVLTATLQISTFYLRSLLVQKTDVPVYEQRPLLRKNLPISGRTYRKIKRIKENLIFTGTHFATRQVLLDKVSLLNNCFVIFWTSGLIKGKHNFCRTHDNIKHVNTENLYVFI